MADNALPPLPEATAVARPRRRLSAVWIIPIIAALMGGWIAVQKLLAEGPRIEISFSSAEGLEPGKTTVKYNGVDVGKIESLKVAEDRQRVLASVQMAPETRDWLVDGTTFWVVRPRISGGTVTGLGTLLSGSYVGMTVGSGTDRLREFTGRDFPPVVAGNTPGRFFLLKAADLGSLDYGTPIYFRRIPVGQVASYRLDDDGSEVSVRIFVKSPYEQFVNAGTRFWQASGLDLSLNANGLSVQTQSLASVLIGGLAFDNPLAGTRAEPAAEDTSFRLFPDEASAKKAPERGASEFVLHLDESVRGLSVGAPLTFLGLPIGEVTAVGLDVGDRRKLQVRARVVIAVYPQRFLDILANPGELTGGKPLSPSVRHAFVDQLVAKGLRAQLRTGSMLTGQLYIALDYIPNAATARVDWQSSPPEFPVARGGLTDIEAKLTSILGKLDALPVAAIGDDLKRSLATLADALAEVDALVKRWRGELTPEVAATLVEARRGFAAAERALDAAGRTIAPDSAVVEELHGTLAEVKRAAQSIRELADYLERHPEALIRGKEAQ